MYEEWLRRRWLDFRNGNSSYLRFGFGFSNTIIIAYFFLIEKVYFFGDWVVSIEIFGILFMLIYVPVSIIVGFWHIKSQSRTEVGTTMQENPLVAKTFYLILRMSQNKVSKKELEEMHAFYERIINKESL